MTIDSKVGIVISILMSVYRLLVKMVALVWIHMGHTSANALIKWLVFIASTEWMTIFKFELNVALRGLTENELLVTFEISYLKAEWKRKERVVGLWLISLSCFYRMCNEYNFNECWAFYWASLSFLYQRSVFTLRQFYQLWSTDEYLTCMHNFFSRKRT